MAGALKKTMVYLGFAEDDRRTHRCGCPATGEGLRPAPVRGDGDTAHLAGARHLRVTSPDVRATIAVAGPAHGARNERGTP